MAGVGVAAYLEVRHIGPSLDGMMANSGRQQSLLQYSEYEGNKKLCQDPQLSLEGHASHNILDWLWFAFDIFYNYGGETSVDSAWQNNRDSTVSGGFTANFTPWRGGKILLNYKDAISAPAGVSRTNAVTLYIGWLF